MLGAITAAGVSDSSDDCPWPETAVGAAVEVRFHLMSDHRPVALDAGLQPYDGGVSRRTGDKLFAIFHDHFHRSAGAQGEQVTDRLVYGSAFAAEIAANHHRVHANFFLGNVQSRRHAFFQALRRLVGRPHLYAILIVDPNQTAVGFEKCLMNTGNRERILNDHIGLRESFGDVPAGENIVNKGIRGPCQRLGESRVAVHVRMNNRGAFLQSRNGIKDRRELLVIDLKELKRLFSLLQSIRSHRRDAFTDETNAILRQHGNVTVAPSVENAAHVGSREDRADAGSFFGARCIDPGDTRMRIWTPQGLGPQSPRQQNIGGVARVTRDFSSIVNPWYRLADNLIAHDGASCAFAVSSRVWKDRSLGHG